MKSPEIYLFPDDGVIPNSIHPVLIYREVFCMEPKAGADWIEGYFKEQLWTNPFRWGIYDFHHYHSNTHEVLGVYAGEALLQLGGVQGQKITVKPGDILVLPAGTGHKALKQSSDFAVVGAYPNGIEPDLIRITDQRPEGIREKLDGVALPENDPVLGKSDLGLLNYWNL